MVQIKEFLSLNIGNCVVELRNEEVRGVHGICFIAGAHAWRTCSISFVT